MAARRLAALAGSTSTVSGAGVDSGSNRRKESRQVGVKHARIGYNKKVEEDTARAGITSRLEPKG